MDSYHVKVSCVSYLNSTPFVYGIKHNHFSGKVDLSLDIPSECAEKLISGKADIGLVPVAAICDIPDAKRISDWCIGADGDVKSVTLLSHVPLQEMDTILLDYHSVTSVNLVKVLAKFFWKINPSFIDAGPGFETEINGTTAGVVIGDRSLKLRNNFPFVYDLAGEWKKFTGLPFVFACWISNKNIDPVFLDEFNNALAYGINHTDDVVEELSDLPGFYEGTSSYLKNNLVYPFTDSMQKGLDLFLEYKNRIAEATLRV